MSDTDWYVVKLKSRTASIPNDIKGFKGVIKYLKELHKNKTLKDYTITIDYVADWEVAERQEYERLKEKFEGTSND